MKEFSDFDPASQEIRYHLSEATLYSYICTDPQYSPLKLTAEGGKWPLQTP